MIFIPGPGAEPAAPIAEAITDASGEVTGFMATASHHPGQVGNLLQQQAPEGGIVPAEPVADHGFEAPTSPAGYRIAPVPQGVQYSPEADRASRQLMMDQGIPVALGNEFSRRATAGMLAPAKSDTQMALDRQSAYTTLSQQWGADTDKNLAAVQKIVDQVAQGTPRIKEFLSRSGLGNDPFFIRSMFNVLRAQGRIK